MEECTWEPIENLTGDCMRMLADFEADLFAEQCKRARCKTDASMGLTALNDASPSSSSLYVEENSPSAASPAASINARPQLIQMPLPMIDLADVKQEEESDQLQLEEQLQEQQLQEEKQEQQLQAGIQEKKMPQKKITPQKQQLQEQQAPELQLPLPLPTPKASPKLCEELNLSSDSSSASDSDSSSSSSGSGSSSNSSTNSKRGDQRKRTPVQPPVSKSNPFFINLDFAHKLNLSSEDDTDDEAEQPATGQTNAMERREVNANSGYVKSSIETLKEQARSWHESKGKASEKPEKQTTARPETQPMPTQPKIPKLLAVPNKIKEQWLKTAAISPETPKSRRRMTMHVNSVEEAMEQVSSWVFGTVKGPDCLMGRILTDT